MHITHTHTSTHAAITHFLFLYLFYTYIFYTCFFTLVFILIFFQNFKHYLFCCVSQCSEACNPFLSVLSPLTFSLEETLHLCAVSYHTLLSALCILSPCLGVCIASLSVLCPVVSSLGGFLSFFKLGALFLIFLHQEHNFQVTAKSRKTLPFHLTVKGSLSGANIAANIFINVVLTQKSFSTTREEWKKGDRLPADPSHPVIWRPKSQLLR